MARWVERPQDGHFHVKIVHAKAWPDGTIVAELALQQTSENKRLR
jgi:hypothetical protein